MNQVVGVADMKLSKDPEDVLITYSLGSCIGVVIYDPVERLGGLLHYMLPESSIDGEKAKKNPFMFGDTGIPILFRESYKMGAKKNRLKIIVAGGALINDQNGLFNIGKRNYMILRKLFWRNNVIPDFEDVGGTVSRTIKLKIKTGHVWIKVPGQQMKRVF